MDLNRVERELKQRWHYPYNWGRKQNDDWDRETNFIYNTYSFKSLEDQARNCSSRVRDYAMNRWYNYWSAKAVEVIFTAHPRVTANRNQFDKLEDFKINNIPFDHKTTVFPREFQKSFAYATQNKRELVKWLYQNQSQQGRKHLKNRIFLVLYESGSLQHWTLKAEIDLMKQEIENYLNKFSATELLKFNFNNEEILSDIIWIKK